MTTVEIVRELDGYGANRGGSACLVRRGDEHFVLSTIPAAPDHGGPETLAFAADEHATVTDWADVAGGRGWTREQTITELERIGPDPKSAGRGVFGDTKKSADRGVAEVIAATLDSLNSLATRAEK